MGLEGGHPDCLPISIPHSDPFFSLHGRSCMNFARVVPGLKQGCGLGPREQFNTISSVIDANTVYSSDPALQRKLRSPCLYYLRYLQSTIYLYFAGRLRAAASKLCQYSPSTASRTCCRSSWRSRTTGA